MDLDKILHWVLAIIFGIFLTVSGYVAGSINKDSSIETVEVEKQVEKVVEKQVVSEGDLAEALNLIFTKGTTHFHVTEYSTYDKENGVGRERRISFNYEDGDLDTGLTAILTDKEPAHLTFIKLIKKTKLLHKQ